MEKFVRSITIDRPSESKTSLPTIIVNGILLLQVSTFSQRYHVKSEFMPHSCAATQPRSRFALPRSHVPNPTKTHALPGWHLAT